ncbi:hypothetical protein K8I28_10025 [bacterium]|nr:hypothetical protein [bacterium]
MISNIRHLLILLFLLFPVVILAQERESKQPQPEPVVRFLDVDGDGFNDLVPDRDRDGIPDDLDPDFRNNDRPWRLALFRSIPDSIKQDSVQFRSWWENSNHPVNWREAWQRWRRHMEAVRRGEDPRWDRRNGLDPRHPGLRDERDGRLRRPGGNERGRDDRGGRGGGQGDGGGGRGRGGGGG